MKRPRLNLRLIDSDHRDSITATVPEPYLDVDVLRNRLSARLTQRRERHVSVVVGAEPRTALDLNASSEVAVRVLRALSEILDQAQRRNHIAQASHMLRRRQSASKLAMVNTT